MNCKKNIFKNTSMLMLLNISKLVFPFITLPYLTRVLSTDCYGVVAYVKAVMAYMQVIVDFGFTLSATKMVVETKTDNKKMSRVVCLNFFSKLILVLFGFSILMVLIISIPLLRNNMWYTILNYIVVALSALLFDFLFRGLEKMHVITIRFVIMKLISTIMTFILIDGDSDIILIPVLDIIASLVAVIWVFFEVKKINIEIMIPEIKECFDVIKESSVYFMSNVASTSFNAFNTIITGIALSTTEIAYWSVCMQIINAIQALYTPISDAIYPEMIRNKNINLIKKVIKIFLPIIALGCVCAFFFGKWALLFLGGKKYIEALPVFRGLIPVLFFGFLSIILGWPSLGAIGKVKETTFSTVVASLFQILTVIILLCIGKVTLIWMTLLRVLTEVILFLIRLYYLKKNKKGFMREG